MGNVFSRILAAGFVAIFAHCVSKARQSQQPRHVHYYNLLEENPKASPDALKAAYKRLSRKLHSDKNCRTHTIEEGKQIGAQDYKLITEAYRVLSDAKLRKLYDEGGAEKVAVYETSPKYKETISDIHEARGGQMVWAYAELRRLFDYAIIGGVKIEQLPMPVMEIYAEYGYANIGQRIEWAFRDGLVCRKCQQKMAYLDAVCVCYHADAEFGTHCFGEQCCPLQEFRQPTFCDNLCEWLSKWSQGNSSAGNGSQHVGLNAITNS